MRPYRIIVRPAGTAAIPQVAATVLAPSPEAAIRAYFGPQAAIVSIGENRAAVVAAELVEVWVTGGLMEDIAA